MYLHKVRSLIVTRNNRLAGVVRRSVTDSDRHMLLVAHSDDAEAPQSCPVADLPPNNRQFLTPDTLDTDAERLRPTAVGSLIKVSQQCIGALGHRHGFGDFVCLVLRIGEEYERGRRV